MDAREVEPMAVENVVEKMVEMTEERLRECGVGAPGDVTACVERELAYVLEFCALKEPDEELCAIGVELAVADVLARTADNGGAVKSLVMGDVSVGFEESSATGARELAEKIYRRAIARLAARRGIKW